MNFICVYQWESMFYIFFANISVVCVPSVANVFGSGYAALGSLWLITFPDQDFVPRWETRRGMRSRKSGLWMERVATASNWGDRELRAIEKPAP